MKRKIFLGLLPITFVTLVFINGITKSETRSKQFYVNGITSVKELNFPRWDQITVVKYSLTNSPIIFDKDPAFFNPSLNNLNFTIDISTDFSVPLINRRVKYDSKIIVVSPFTCLKIENGIYTGYISLNITVKSTRSDKIPVADIKSIKTVAFSFDPVKKMGHLVLDTLLPSVPEGGKFDVNFSAAQDPFASPTPVQSPCSK